MLSTEIDVKEQIAEARRSQILVGAAQVFQEKGFHKATTKEIAKAAGVSEGTIYNYFGAKRDLLVALVDMIGTQSLRTLILDTPPDNPRDLIKAIMRDRYKLVKDNGHIIAPVIAEVFNDVELRRLLYQQIIMPMAQHLEEYLQTHATSGEFRQLHPMVVTRAIMGALVMNFVLKLTELDPRYDEISEEELIDQLSTLVLDGLLLNDQSIEK
jgi:AcrR family transcriptional regulator